MSTTTSGTLADLLARLGDVPPARIRLMPPPGTATEADVLDVEAREDRLCELVDGVLVEKGMGYRESLIAIALVARIYAFVSRAHLGLVTGEAGMVRLFPGLVRIPDVAFVSWARIPGGKVPDKAIPALVPDLAVEVLSESDTRGEMERKLGEYFSAGVRLVWLIDIRDRSIDVYSAPSLCRRVAGVDVLGGDDVLPGFELPLAELFGELDQVE